MTYILTLKRNRNGEVSALFVDDYATPQDKLDVLVNGEWHFLKNLEVVKVAQVDDATFFQPHNNEVLVKLEAE